MDKKEMLTVSLVNYELPYLLSIWAPALLGKVSIHRRLANQQRVSYSVFITYKIIILLFTRFLTMIMQYW